MAGKTASKADGFRVRQQFADHRPQQRAKRPDDGHAQTAQPVGGFTLLGRVLRQPKHHAFVIHNVAAREAQAAFADQLAHRDAKRNVAGVNQ